MKNSFLLVCVLGLAFHAFAQDKKPQQKNGAVITWEKKNHDFGNIVQGDNVEHTFYFTNTGNEPLIITSVDISCGCTTAKGWPRDPVPPGGNGEITVSFASAGNMGIQRSLLSSYQTPLTRKAIPLRSPPPCWTKKHSKEITNAESMSSREN